MKNNLLPVAKEGWNYIGYSILAFIVSAVLDLGILEFLAFLSTVFFIFVFRNPERELPRFEQNSVISPVDGTVLAIDEINSSDYAYKVTVESSYADVSILRTPVSGLIYSIHKENGARLGKESSLSHTLNENATIVFEDSNSNRLKVSHMLKQSFCGIKLDPFKSQKIVQTSRYGVMVNGITTIYLPQNFRLNISIGNELKSSENLIGYFS